MKNIYFTSKLNSVAVLAAISLLSLNLFAADPFEGLPTPGLYKVDSDATITNYGPHGSKTHVRLQQPSSGDVTATWTGPENASATRTIQNGEASNVCIPPRDKSKPAFVPPTSASCETTAPSKTKLGWVLKSKCSFADITTTIRQIDAKTWEFENHVLQSMMPSAAGNAAAMGGMRAMLENAAKNALTEKERNEAKKNLEQLPALEAQMAKQGAQIDAMKPQIEKMQAKHGVVAKPRETVSKAKWIRIADVCSDKTKN